MNALIDAAFDRHRTVLLLLIFLILSGIYAYASIPKESEPDVPIPVIYVSMTHDGISPEDAERLLVRPMETELQGITGIKTMSSTSGEGHASVTLEFDAGFDGETALADVREKVDAAKSQLPEATDEPSVNEINVALFPILNLSLSGSLPERTLTRIARELKDQLESLPGVLEADIAGEREEVLEIIVDPLVMQSYEVSFEELLSLIRNNNLLVAAGAIDTGAGRMVLKVPGVIEDIEDVLRLPVKVTDEAVVVFGDVARINRTFKDPDGFARLDGQPTLVLEISKRLGANIIETVESIRAVIEEARQQLPPGLRIDYLQDKSEETRVMLTDLQNNVISGVVLVMIVIMAALGIRSSMLVGLAIPGSFLIGILVINAFGYTMNIVVLFSLILVVGMLVDGAIIVIELADRNIDEGQPPALAYANAAKRMAWPIIASTFTTLVVFFPLLFWPGMIGQFMRYMPITVITCLLASLAMALVFIPVMGKLIGARRAASSPVPSPVASVSSGSVSPLRIGKVRTAADLNEHSVQDTARSSVFGRDPQKYSAGMTLAYLRLLQRLLLHPVLTLLAVVVFTGGSYLAYGLLGNGVEFFPSTEPETLALRVHARGDLSIGEQDAILKRIESRLTGRDDVVSAYARTGAGDRDAGDVIGSIQLELTDWDSRAKAAAITEELRESLADIAGVRVEVLADEGGPDGGGKPVNLEVSAADSEVMNQGVEQVRTAMRKIGGFTDIDDNRSLPGIEWRIEVDREEAARYGADVALIGNAIQMVTTGIRVAGYRPDDATDEVDIRVRYPMAQRTLDSIKQLQVPTSRGMVPVTNFVTIEPAPKTGVIQRVDGRRVITVEADAAEGQLPDTLLDELRDELTANPLAAGVDLQFKGEAADQQETMSFLMMAFVSAIFLMTIILVTQFNSLYQTLLILSAILFSTSGVLIGLLVTGQSFGIVMVGIGIIALAGIVVNNNIVLIDTYNSFRREGVPAIDAAMHTGHLRLRPVLLTAITTVLGLMPMVLSMNVDLLQRTVTFGAPSTQWWTQLSSAIAGGLAFTTLLTLLLTPCLLVLGDSVAQRLARRFKFRRSRDRRDAPGDTVSAG